MTDELRALLDALGAKDNHGDWDRQVEGRGWMKISEIAAELCALLQPLEGEEVEPVAQAVLFILECDGMILMECCPQKGALFNAEWFIPGGRVEVGETYEDTLKREMMEELGCSPIDVRWLGFLDRTPPEHPTFLMQVAHVISWDGEIPEHNLAMPEAALQWMPLKKVERSKVPGIRSAMAVAFGDTSPQPLATVEQEPVGFEAECPECGLTLLGRP